MEFKNVYVFKFFALVFLFLNEILKVFQSYT